MMTALFPGTAARMEAAGNVSASSDGTTITAHATPGSDGAWTQLIAATVDEWYGMTVLIGYGGTLSGTQLIDIGIGGAGSEVILIPDIPALVRSTLGRCPCVRLIVPIRIAAGSRIAARVHRASAASVANSISIQGQSGVSRSIPPFSRATSYGVVLGSAAGTTVDPGGTANTQGAMTQLDASTANPIRVMYVIVTRNQVTAVVQNPSSLLEIFIGAGGSEVSLIPEFSSWAMSGTFDISSGETVHGPFFVNLPAGTRLAAKARCSDNTVTVREGMVTILGLD